MNQLDDITMTDRSRRTANHQLLSDTHAHTGEITPPSIPPCQTGDLPACPGQTVDLPARVFDDPPVVDVFKGITCDLLLVRAAPPILIPEHTNRK